jgi:hypothetical protein
MVNWRKAKFLLFGAIFFILPFFALPANSAFNPQINYQGKLMDAVGKPAEDGQYKMIFELFDVSTGGTALWSENRSSSNNVTATSGLFSVMLGEVEAFPADFNFNQTLYLQVQVGTSSLEILMPRKKLGAVPSAFYASTSTYSSNSGQLEGYTWASPGAIGTGTATTAVFTSATTTNILRVIGNSYFGAIASGTWQGDIVSSTYGGTGQNSSAWTGFVKVTGGTWSTSSVSLTSDVSGVLPVVNGGTGQSTYTNGQLLIGNTTGNTLTKATLTADSGITITNGAGSISIAHTAHIGDVTGTTTLTIATGAVNSAKILDNTIQPIDLATTTPSPGGLSLLSYNGSTFVWTASTTFSSSTHTHATLSQGTGIATFSYNGLSAATVGLATSGVTAGTYGTVSAVPILVVDTYGRITSASTSSIAISASQITSGILPIARGGTNTSTIGVAGSIPYSDATSYRFTAAGTSGQLLMSNGSSAPTWASTSSLGFTPVGSPLASGSIWVGNASNLATAVAMSGDATLASTGVLTITNNAITSAKILNGTIQTIDISSSTASPNIGNLLTYDNEKFAWVSTSSLGITSAGGWTDDGTTVRLTTASDSVGIGTTTPATKLHITSADEQGIFISESTSNIIVAKLYHDDPSGNAAGKLSLLSGGSEIVSLGGGLSAFINSNVGIGTTAPSTSLHIVGGGLLVTGTTGATPVSGAGTRLMWIPAKGAFRAGYVNNTQWDDNNIGDYSFAVGEQNIASGEKSTAFGGYNTASGTYSFTFGYSNIASGWMSTALGYNVEATADLTFGINVSSTISPILSQPNTIALMGGNVGIGTTTPATKLHITSADEQGIFISESTSNIIVAKLYHDDPSGNAAGKLSLLSGGSEIVSLGGGLSAFINSNVGIGTTAPSTSLHIVGGGLLVTGTTGATPVSGAGTRLMWIPAKGAFRAGYVNNTQWDDNNIGDYSFAVGEQNIASGEKSTAFGGYNTASGTYSFTFGFSNIASGWMSTALGYNVEATADLTFGINVSTTISPILSQPNTIALMGGNVGIGTTTPTYNLTVAGDLAVAGTIRVGDTADAGLPGYVLMSNGGIVAPSWISSTTMASASGWTDDGDTVRLTTASDKVGIGTTAPSTSLHIVGGGLLVTGTTGATPVSGAGTRLMWIPAKGAFRAGQVSDNSWDDNKIGPHSFAGGYNNTALGEYSTAFGGQNTAVGSYSFAIGYGNNANGYMSVAFGHSMTVATAAEHSFGINVSSTAPVTLSQPNTIALMGGNVGIGTTTPNKKFAVVVNSLNDGFGVFNNSGLALAGGGSSAVDLNAGSLAAYYNGSAVSYLQATGTTMLQVNGTAFRVSNLGKLEINTNNFVVASDGNLEIIRGIVYTWPTSHGAPGTLMTQNGYGVLSWVSTSSLLSSAGGWTDDGTIVRLTTLGDKVGINTVSAFAPLHVGDTSNDGSIIAGGLFGSGYSLNLSQNNPYFVWSSKRAAIRAGMPGSDLAWDDAYVGNYSVAMGYHTAATGTASVAIGGYNVATANYATALGSNMAVAGDYSFGINVSSTAATLSQANTIALMGGNVGINTTTPVFKLTVDGGIYASGTYGAGETLTYSGAGTRMIWYPKKAAFRAGYVSSEQWNDGNIGDFSVAMGGDNRASGKGSISFGAANTSSIVYGVTMGRNNQAKGTPISPEIGGAIALGYGNIASGTAAVALGSNNQALNHLSVAIGGENLAEGTNAVAIGYSTHAKGNYSTTFGYDTYARVDYATAFGYITEAQGMYSTAFGIGAVAGGNWSTAFGSSTLASGNFSTAFGADNTASGFMATAFGYSNEAIGDYSTVFGYDNIATGTYAVAFGAQNSTNGTSSIVMGYRSQANGENSMAFGDSVIASGIGSKAFGTNINVSGQNSIGLSVGGASTLSQNNTFALMGGNVGIGTTYPSSTLHVNNGGLLVTGTTGGTPVSGAGTRLMWIPAKGAFRAGGVDGAQWNDANIGDYSVAFGLNNTSSHPYSAAFGWLNTASNQAATVFGIESKASGYGSTAFGHFMTVAGTYSFGINLALNTPATLSQDYTMAVMGGNVGINTTTPGYKLTVAGDLAVTGTLRVGNALSAGIAGQVLSSNGNSAPLWINTSDFSSAAGWTRDSGNIYTTTLTDNVGIGTSTPASKLHVHNGGLLVTGTTGGTPVSGVGTRLMWIPAKGAFRAGYAQTSFWDDANIGNYSVSFGYANRSTGLYSATFGNGNTASATSSIAFGNTNNATGNYAVSFGAYNTASGQVSVAGGGYNNVGSDYGVALGYENVASNGSVAIAIGRSNTSTGSSAIALGIGMTVSGNYSVGINVSTTGATLSQANTIALMGGNVGIGTVTPSYTLDVNGNINIPLTSDTAGVISMNGARYIHSMGGQTNFYAGPGSGNTSATAGYNVGIGGNALMSISSGVGSNVAVGYNAGRSITTGEGNVAIGINTFYQSGGAASGNVAIGKHTLYTTQSNYNTAVGYSSMRLNSTGEGNVAVGYFSLYTNATGANNTAVGYGAVASTTGNNNTAFGYNALAKALNSDNTAIGSLALSSLTSGQYNVAIGSAAGSDAAFNAENGNTLLGYATQIVNGTDYATAIGYGAIASGDGTITFGTATYGQIYMPGITSSTVAGSVYICRLPSTGRLNAQYGACGSSDANLKINKKTISEELDVLETVKHMRGIYFNWDTSNPYANSEESRQIGVIAQEVIEYLPEIVRLDEESGYYSVDYPKLTAFLIEVAREQQIILEPLTSNIFVNTSTNIISIGSTSSSYSLNFTGNLNFLATADSYQYGHKLNFSTTTIFESSVSSTPDSRAFIFNALNFNTSDSDKYILSLRSNNNPTFSVSANGDVHALGNMYAASAILGTSTNPGDLAERVDINPNETVEAGDVMMVDPASPDRYQKSNQAYEPTVAGVISTNPTIVVGNGKTDQTAPLAMVGRVPVKYSEENGPIQRGDLLVSAGTPGYAMKYNPETDNSRKIVGIIGIALDNSFESTNGKVMALIRTGWVYNKTQAVSNLEQQVYYVASSVGIDFSTNPEELNINSTGSTLTYDSNNNLNLSNHSIINIKSIISTNNKWTIDENGLLITKITTSQGDKNLYGMVSESIEITLSGSDQLTSGEATITFAPDIQEMMDENEVIKVSVTLTSIDAKGVAVISKSAQGFTVKELNNGKSNATFDWIVIAKRRAITIESSSESEIIEDASSSGLPVDENPAGDELTQAGEGESTTDEFSSPAGDSEESTEPLIEEEPATEPAPEPPSEPAPETPVD